MAPTDQQPEPRVSALVISRNNIDGLRRCLQALTASDIAAEMEIVVADNGSRDGSANLDQEFPNANFLRLPKNFGWTKAANIGTRTAKAEYLLVLPAGLEVQPDTVSKLVAVLDERSAVVLACPRVLDAEGRPASQPLPLPGPDSIGSYPDGLAPIAATLQPARVPYMPGKAFLTRRSFVKGMNYFDERYAETWSDVDLFYRAYTSQREAWLIPDAVATLHGSPAESSVLVRADHLLGAAAFAGKHFGTAKGVQLRIGGMLRALASVDLGLLKNVAAGQRIDGTQAD